MIVVVIIGLMAAVGIPAMTKMQRAAMVTRFASDLRVIGGALQQFNTEHGGWPEQNLETMPDGFADYLSTSVKLAPTPVGGAWAWHLNQNEVYASLAVVNVTAPLSVMIQIDRRVDDGDLTSGEFRGSGSTYYRVIEP